MLEGVRAPSDMTLATVSRKICASQSPLPKIDGRCYNVRSQNKTKWEVYNLRRLRDKTSRNAKRRSLVRGVYSKEELEEYKAIQRAEREAMAQKKEPNPKPHKK